MERLNTLTNTNRITVGDKLHGLDSLDWQRISCCDDLSVEFIHTYESNIDWEALSYSQYITIDIMREFADALDWELISAQITLSEYPMEFYHEFKDRLDWVVISLRLNNPEFKQWYSDFHKKFGEYLGWKIVAGKPVRIS